MFEKCIECDQIKYFVYKNSDIEGEYGCGHPNKRTGECPIGK